MKKLKANTKALSASLDTLCQAANDQHEALGKLQAAAARIKPKPDKKAAVGDNPELRKLLQSSRLSQASSRYAASYREVDAQLSSRGQQQSMLSNLVSMTNICVEQHTGGKAGEALESRRDTRLIHAALQGLRNGQGPLDKAAKGVAKLPPPSKPVTEATSISDLGDHAKDAEAARGAANDISAAFVEFESELEDSCKIAMQGFAAAEDGDVT
jgi:hypothetical protein